MLDLVPGRRQRGDVSDARSRWRLAKHAVLGAVLVSAALGSLTLLVMDPMTLLFRSVGSVAVPALSFLVNTGEIWLYRLGQMQPVLEWADGLVRGWLLTAQPFTLTGLRHEHQGWNNCGPTTLAMALSYWGRSETQYDVAPVLKPDPEDKNVSLSEMETYTRDLGLSAIVRAGGTLERLKALVRAGFPFIAETG